MHFPMIFSVCFFFDRYFILSSDEIIPPPPPPERKIIPPQPVAVEPSTEPKPSTTRSFYKTLRSSFKPLSSSKKLGHARSTPDLSSLISDNKDNDDANDTSSSIENLSKNYSSLNLPQQRPTGSILKRRSQPPSTPKQIQEEPIYISSASVPLQRSGIRSVQSMIRDQNPNILAR
jgi:hypothetical protein